MKTTAVWYILVGSPAFETKFPIIWPDSGLRGRRLPCNNRLVGFAKNAIPTPLYTWALKKGTRFRIIFAKDPRPYDHFKRVFTRALINKINFCAADGLNHLVSNYFKFLGVFFRIEKSIRNIYKFNNCDILLASKKRGSFLSTNATSA